MQGVRIKQKSSAANAKKQEKEKQQGLPQWIEAMQQTYADEISAFLLLAIGLWTFISLVTPESGSLGDPWAGFLYRSFGLGSFVVAGAIMMAGILLLLPKLGMVFRFNWWRIVAGEVLFFATLAYIQASIRFFIGGEQGQIEALASATEGAGGGLVGWALQDLLHSLLGNVVTGAILLGIMTLSTFAVLGIRRSVIMEALEKAQIRLVHLAARLNPKSTAAAVLAPPTAEHAGEAVSDGAPAPYNPLHGRPSIVTGATSRIPEPAPRPIEEQVAEKKAEPRDFRTMRERLMEEGLETGEITMRFELGNLKDKKRKGRRSKKLPSMELLDEIDFDRPSDLEINVNVHVIEKTVEDFGMDVEVVGVKAGPTVTQYAVQPFSKKGKDGTRTVKRVRVTRVAGLASDLSLALAARTVRIQAPVPGTNYIGVEVPNPQPGIVSLRPVMESEQFYKYKSPLTIALGREVDGKPIAADLGRMPHLLIGGTTGSGKSVALRTLATCLIVNNTPEQLKMIMIDPKMVELIRFNGLPHLLGRVEVEAERAIGVLRWVTREMDRRYKLMEEAQARNIAIYNQGVRGKARLPYMVVLIDELAELMTEFHDETEHLLTRLAQMARATGIHLVVATQRPSTDVLTGLIKANFPARIAFAVASGTDSRVIIDSVGAEDLIGKGDMLYQSPEAMAPVRAQGCFVSDLEMEALVDYWVENWEEDEEPGTAPWEKSLARDALIEATDPMLMEAIRIVQDDQVASASLLQRKLNVGYPRAGRIIDSLFRLGVVGPDQSGGKLRDVHIPRDADPTDFLIEQREKRMRG